MLLTSTLLLMALPLHQPVAGGPGAGRVGEPDSLGLWTQWRGTARDGQTPGPAWGADLSEEHLTEAWRIEGLGPSYSGPVADATRVYTTETVDEEYELVRAFDRATGEELWQASWQGAMEVPFFAARNGSWIRSTPAIDGGALYVAGMRDILASLDAETGDILWTVDFTERYGTELQPFGFVSSPLVHGDALILQAGHSLLKLDKHTGGTIWRSMQDEGDMMSAGAFSSPIVAELAGLAQVVVQSRTHLAGVDLEDGQVLWSTPVKSYRGMNILTPTVLGDSLFTSTYGGRSQRYTVFQDKQGLEVMQDWNTGVQGYMTSPVVAGDHAYLFLKSNRFACIDLTSGEERWTSPPTGDEYWSLAVQGDRILALANTGRLRLLEADPAGYRVLSEREVAEAETWAHVAPAGHQIFVRAQDGLLALDWK